MSTIKLKFKNINSVNNKAPQMAVHVNSKELYKGLVLEQHVMDVDLREQNILKISGTDKQQVGMVAAEIKSIRPPEPYKGKGIKEQGQYILRKEGKKK